VAHSRLVKRRTAIQLCRIVEGQTPTKSEERLGCGQSP